MPIPPVLGTPPLSPQGYFPPHPCGQPSILSIQAAPTPAHQAQLQEVVPKVGVEDPDGEQVEVEGFQAHPGEDTEQEVVVDGPPGPAGSIRALRATPHSDQEGQIQQEQAATQGHVDLRGIF
ncbi:hypothetical protein P7K49_036434 [Saguinus oedipus]|uniref:Uncharacterized protein n=1 Tax=Saguinus oedipus TaxID=9490 RepID=A0ABQ9TK90_SAGOE|nr:hypothetical protein P7K49_036434 [Saguinus oedipus]